MKPTKLNPQSRRNSPRTFFEVTKWNIGDWTEIPREKGVGNFFVKVGQHKSISKFAIIGSNGEILGRTQGLRFNGKIIF